MKCSLADGQVPAEVFVRMLAFVALVSGAAALPTNRRRSLSSMDGP